MRSSKHIAVWSALVLMMGHMLVPHHHCETEEPTFCDAHHIPSSSPLDVLAGIFETDLGEDHLEHFDLPLSGGAALAKDQSAIQFSPYATKLYLDHSARFIAGSALRLHGERGPPIV